MTISTSSSVFHVIAFFRSANANHLSFVVRQRRADGEHQVVTLDTALEELTAEWAAGLEELRGQPGGRELYIAWRTELYPDVTNAEGIQGAVEQDRERLERARAVFETRWGRIHYVAATGALGDRFSLENFDAAVTEAEAFDRRAGDLSDGVGRVELEVVTGEGRKPTVAELAAALERGEEAERTEEAERKRATARRGAAVRRREAAVRKTGSGQAWLNVAKEDVLQGADRRPTLEERGRIVEVAVGWFREELDRRRKELCSTKEGARFLDEAQRSAGAVETLAAEEQLVDAAAEQLLELLWKQPGGQDLHDAVLTGLDPEWRDSGESTVENLGRAVTLALSDGESLGRLREVLTERDDAARYREALNARQEHFTVEDIYTAIDVVQRHRAEEVRQQRAAEEARQWAAAAEARQRAAAEARQRVEEARQRAAAAEVRQQRAAAEARQRVEEARQRAAAEETERQAAAEEQAAAARADAKISDTIRDYALPTVGGTVCLDDDDIVALVDELERLGEPDLGVRVSHLHARDDETVAKRAAAREAYGPVPRTEQLAEQVRVIYRCASDPDAEPLPNPAALATILRREAASIEGTVARAIAIETPGGGIAARAAAQRAQEEADRQAAEKVAAAAQRAQEEADRQAAEWVAADAQRAREEAERQAAEKIEDELQEKPPRFKAPTGEQLLEAVLTGKDGARPYREMFRGATPSEDNVTSLCHEAIDPNLLRVALGRELARTWVPPLNREYEKMRHHNPDAVVHIERSWADQRARRDDVTGRGLAQEIREKVPEGTMSNEAIAVAQNLLDTRRDTEPLADVALEALAFLKTTDPDVAAAREEAELERMQPEILATHQKALDRYSDLSWRERLQTSKPTDEEAVATVRHSMVLRVIERIIRLCRAALGLDLRIGGDPGVAPPPSRPSAPMPTLADKNRHMDTPGR